MSWWSSVRHVAADVLTAPSRATASVLRDVGATGLANDIDGFDSQVSSFIGGAQPELQLGQTDDPTQLIHGNPQQVGDAATRLKAFSTAFGEVATGLAGVNVEHWQGAAADAFRAKYAPEPKRWSDAGTACGESSAALQDYAHTLTWAQDQARDAITLYARGQQATAHAEAAYNTAVSDYNTKAASYNAALQAGRNPGVKPVQPGPFVDPGASDRAEAQSVLSAARSRRDAAADQAQTTLARATDLAPATPSFLTQMRDDLSDGWNIDQLGTVHFAGGFLSGASGFLDFLRSANPTDPYNVVHPGEYLAGLDSLQAGLVDMSLHPSALINSVIGTGWRSDPFNAGGNLTFNLLLLAEGGDDLDSINPAERVTEGDPVDVATGDVLLSQTDVSLPGLLPLVIERTHISSYRIGQWFGPSWASSLDQRLDVAPEGVTFEAANGVKLRYPHPDTVGGIAWPHAGARWPLRRTESGGYLVADPAAGQVWVFETHAGMGIWPISWIGNRAGHRLLFVYADDGRPSGLLHSGGYRIRIDTSDDGRVRGLYLLGAAGGEIELVRYGYADGHLTEVFNSSGLPVRFTYDEAGRMTSWRDRNDVTYRYGYDAEGRVQWAAGPDGMLSVTLGYDTDRRITTVTDAAGNVSQYAMNECGRVIAETDPLGSTTLSDWDSHGRLTGRTDPLGATTGYDYDDLGNLLEVRFPDGSRSTLEYDQWSQPVTVTGPDGAAWRYGYDSEGNRISENDPSAGVTRYEHNEHGGLAAIIDPLGAVTQVESDEAGLPTVLTDPAGGVTRLERDAFGRVVSVTDPVGGVARLGWTIEGKLAWRTSATGGTELWTYDGEGNLTSYTDADGRVIHTEYSHLDLPSAQTGPDGARMEFRYDTAMHLTTVINPDGLTWHYQYDAAGRLTAETDFNGRTLRYERDAAGRLVSRTNGAGQTVHYRLDVAGNVIEQRADASLTTFAYDPAGRLLRAVNGDATLEYTYDPLGRVLAETCNGRPLTSTYDMAGQRLGRRTPAGVDSAWAFDPAGRIESLRTGDRALVFQHDGAGREILRRIGDAATLTQRWDADHRLTAQSVWNTAGQAQPGGPVQYRAYTYSQASDVLAIANHLTGDRRFEMDPVGRITAVHGLQWTERYRYDATGNLTGADVPAAGANATGALGYSGTLIRHAGQYSFTHDGQGRITTRRAKSLSGKVKTWAYTWDAEDRLTDVVAPDGHYWRYRYDPIGRRIAKEHYAEDGTTLLETTAFTWDGPVLIEEASQRPGEPLRTTTWDYEPGSFTPLTQTERTGLRDAPQSEVDQRFYAIITDLIGTPSELIGPGGELAGHQMHTLWGTTTWLTGGASTPLRFPGQYADPETGLHYNYQRYYDPITGAYLTPDPLGLTPTPNPHTYVPNPTVLVDPLGLAPYKTGGPAPDEPATPNERAPWNLTREGASQVMQGGPFNTTFYKSASDGTWWTRDMAGHGSVPDDAPYFKVYRQTSKGLQWIFDANKYGNYISGKWKGDTGYFIPWKDLKGKG